jgi:TolB-like protein
MPIQRALRIAAARRPVLPCSLLCALLTALSLLAPGRAAAEAPNTTVAVLYFDYSGQSEDMAFLRKGLNQMLVSDLIGTPGITVVERVQLEEVLAEVKLNQQKTIDRDSAVRIGKLLGAHYLLMGAYFDFQDSLHVSIKIVHVETGAVVAGVRDRRAIDAFWELEQHLAAELATVMQDKLKPPAPVKATRRPRRDRGRQASTSKREPGDAVKASDRVTSDRMTHDAPPGGERIPAAGAGKQRPHVNARTAARYGKALDAMDRGDRAQADAELRQVLREQPDFRLASLDLASLAR